jgi:hypothetical protein
MSDNDFAKQFEITSPCIGLIGLIGLIGPIGLVGLLTPLCYPMCTTSEDFRRGVMADEKEQCKNPSCTCPPQPGGKYCSASCEGTGKTIELDCDCGHEECGGNF